jgi:Uma2 family endonuclease
MVIEKTAPPKRSLKTLFTAEELFCLPADERRLELVKGKLYEMAPAGGRPGRVAMRIGRLLDAHVELTGLGQVFAAETGFTLQRNPDTVRAPDAAFVAQDRMPPGETPDGYLALAPDLAVEVISPNDRPREVREKVADWLNAGTRLVWVIYPASRTVAVHRPPDSVEELGEVDTLDGADVVPGFYCRVAELFG